MVISTRNLLVPKYRYWDGVKMAYGVCFDSWGNVVIGTGVKPTTGTVMQSTNIYDINGLEIFEYDIVKYQTIKSVGVVEVAVTPNPYGVLNQFTVEFVLKIMDDGDDLATIRRFPWDYKKMTIVGNIFETPNKLPWVKKATDKRRGRRGRKRSS